MFYQVYVHPINSKCSRFLCWLDGDLEKAPAEYRKLIHLFRGTSSPSCAKCALRKTATDNHAEFDKAAVDTVLIDLCVIDNINCYLARTKHCRGSCQNLPISTVKPFQPVSSRCKEVLSNAGVDGRLVGAHSI